MSLLVRSALIATLFACGSGASSSDAPIQSGDAAGLADAATEIVWQQAPALPVAISNNAVTATADCGVLSASGIGGSLFAADITATAYWLAPAASQWIDVGSVPGPKRIAAVALSVADRIYVIGGYTISNGQETTLNRMDIFNTETLSWSSGPAVPVPVDDQVAGVWRNRYLVLATGWSNSGNVRNVQLYDTQTQEWQQATQFPGEPVFGAGGGVVDDTLLIVDGSDFDIIPQAWMGTLNPNNPSQITWTEIPTHSGPPRYRPGSASVGNSLWMHGGTAQPYNYNGRRYDNNQPAEPIADTLVYSIESGWSLLPANDIATMDHRGLGSCDDRVFLVGGMIVDPNPAPTSAVFVRSK